MQINCIKLVYAANAVENEEKTTIYGETKGWPDLMCTHFSPRKIWCQLKYFDFVLYFSIT